MEPLFPNLRYGSMLVLSHKLPGGFLLQLIKNGTVVHQETFADWNTYQQRYDMVATMLRQRSRMGY